MQNMAEQLNQLGLIPEKTLSLRRAQEELRDAQKVIAAPTVNDLDSCKNMDQFNALAKVVLSDDPTQIEAIIHKAHRFKNPKSLRCKHFIWCWYQVQDKIKEIPEDQLPTFLDRALRRHNPAFELPT